MLDFILTVLIFVAALTALVRFAGLGVRAPARLAQHCLATRRPQCYAC